MTEEPRLRHRVTFLKLLRPELVPSTTFASVKTLLVVYVHYTQILPEHARGKASPKIQSLTLLLSYPTKSGD